MAELDDLFNGSLDSKMDFLNDQKSTTSNDGIYRVDLAKWMEIRSKIPS